eukprot:2153472-Lingulodinium_polyedra.AAC.1
MRARGWCPRPQSTSTAPRTRQPPGEAVDQAHPPPLTPHGGEGGGGAPRGSNDPEAKPPSPKTRRPHLPPRRT